MYKLGFVVLVLALGSAIAIPLKHNEATCAFPNGTDVKIHSYNCDGTQPLTVQDFQVYDSDGNVMYPIDPRKAMILDLNSVNNGIEHTGSHVKYGIWSYSTNWITGDCTWAEEPTFGLLNNNVDEPSYPLVTGPLDLKLPLDLSGVASMIHMDKPYQLEVRMFDYNQGSQHEEIACVVAQIRFSEKTM